MQSYGVALSVRTRSIFKPDATGRESWRTVAAGATFDLCDPDPAYADLSPEERRRVALDRFDDFCVPIDEDRLEKWIAELSVISARREKSEADSALMVEAYVARLKPFPADVVRAALFEARWKFWPTWSELSAEIDRLMAPRAVMRAALEGGKAYEPPEPKEHIDYERRKRLVEEMTKPLLSEILAAEKEAARSRAWPARDERTMSDAELKDLRLARLRNRRLTAPETMTEADLLALADLEEWERGMS